MSGSNSKDNSLTDKTCGICLEQFTKNSRAPISLNCGHTFCRRCVARLNTVMDDAGCPIHNNKYELICGTCRAMTYSTPDRMRKNVMLCEFLEDEKQLADTDNEDELVKNSRQKPQPCNGHGNEQQNFDGDTHPIRNRNDFEPVGLIRFGALSEMVYRCDQAQNSLAGLQRIGEITLPRIQEFEAKIYEFQNIVEEHERKAKSMEEKFNDDARKLFDLTAQMNDFTYEILTANNLQSIPMNGGFYSIRDFNHQNEGWNEALAEYEEEEPGWGWWGSTEHGWDVSPADYLFNDNSRRRRHRRNNNRNRNTNQIRNHSADAEADNVEVVHSEHSTNQRTPEQDINTELTAQNNSGVINTELAAQNNSGVIFDQQNGRDNNDDWNNSTPNGWDDEDDNDFVQGQANPVIDFQPQQDSNFEKRNGDSSTPGGNEAAYDDWNNSTPNGWDDNDFVQTQPNPVTDFQQNSNFEKRNDDSTPGGKRNDDSTPGGDKAAYDDWNNSTPNGWDNNDFVQAQANPVTDFHHDSNSEKRNGDSSTPVGDETLQQLESMFSRSSKSIPIVNRNNEQLRESRNEPMRGSSTTTSRFGHVSPNYSTTTSRFGHVSPNAKWRSNYKASQQGATGLCVTTARNNRTIRSRGPPLSGSNRIAIGENAENRFGSTSQFPRRKGV